MNKEDEEHKKHPPIEAVYLKEGTREVLRSFTNERNEPCFSEAEIEKELKDCPEEKTLPFIKPVN